MRQKSDCASASLPAVWCCSASPSASGGLLVALTTRWNARRERSYQPRKVTTLNTPNVEVSVVRQSKYQAWQRDNHDGAWITSKESPEIAAEALSKSVGQPGVTCFHCTRCISLPFHCHAPAELLEHGGAF
jgi:hypothetical protein